MNNIDPALNDLSLYSPITPFSSVSSSSPWMEQPQQAQGYLQDSQKAAFFRTPPQISDLPTPQPRHGSPYLTNEYDSSCSSLLSPPSESELQYETPPTPPGSTDMIMPYSSPNSLRQPYNLWAPVTTAFGNCPTMTAFTDPFALSTADDLAGDLMDDGNATSYPLNHALPPSAYLIQSDAPDGYAVDIACAPDTPRVHGFDSSVLPAAEVGPPNKNFGDYYPSPSVHDDNLDSEVGSPIIKFEVDDSPAPKEAPRQKRNSSSSPSKRKQKQTPKQTSDQVTEADSFVKRRKLSDPDIVPQHRLSNPKIGVETPNTALASSVSSPGISSPQTDSESKESGQNKCTECKRTTFKNETALQAHVKKHHTRPFFCIFAFAGCDATFPSKNEWKRHVMSQHLLLHYWICTHDTCANTDNNGVAISGAPLSGRSHRTPANAPRPGSLRGRNSCAIAPAASSLRHGLRRFGPPLPNGAVFNRKDLYTQHVRRMHMPKDLKEQQNVAGDVGQKGGSGKKVSSDGAWSGAVEQLNDWEKHVKQLQQYAEKERCTLPIYMTCPVKSCGEHFEGSDTWDLRMEHLARHFEAAGKGEEPPVPSSGEADPSLVSWASDENVAIVVKCGTQWVLNNPLKPTDVAVMAAAANKLAAAAAGSFTLGSSAMSPGDVGEEDAEGELED